MIVIGGVRNFAGRNVQILSGSCVVRLAYKVAINVHTTVSWFGRFFLLVSIVSLSSIIFNISACKTCLSNGVILFLLSETPGLLSVSEVVTEADARFDSVCIPLGEIDEKHNFPSLFWLSLWFGALPDCSSLSELLPVGTFADAAFVGEVSFALSPHSKGLF